MTPNKEASKIYNNIQELPNKSRIFNQHKSALTPLNEKLEVKTSAKVIKDFSSTNMNLHIIPADHENELSNIRNKKQLVQILGAR